MRSPKTIFIVDDEPAIMKTLVLVLNHSKQNLFAVGCTDIAEALSIIRGIRPDLVLLDVMMPGVKGLEHALEMRDQCGCQVMLMSGNIDTKEILEEAARKGHEPFEIVAKPIHPSDLLRKVDELVNPKALRLGTSN